MRAKALVLLFFLHISIQGGECKRLEGLLDTDSRWKFLARFCFMDQLGGMAYDIEYPKAYGRQRLLFYYDTPGQWSFVYGRDKTCETKAAVATNVFNYFTLDDSGSSPCKTIKRDGEDWYKCSNTLSFHSSRERWWYLVVERCADPTDSSKKGLYMEYELHLTNGEDLLHKEFSADQFYILPINIVFFILYVIMLILSTVIAFILKKKQLYHRTYAMYMVSVTIWTLSLFCLVIAWGSYGNTGWEMKRMEVFGRILQAASTIIFMLMLVLMAKGYTIVRGRLTNKASVKMTVFIMLYIVVTITLFVWEANIFDEGKVLFYYENPAGYSMVAIQLLGWLWMTKAAVFTLKHHSNTTAKFYIPFYVLFTLWFWLAPIVIMLAIFVMPKWMREKTVHGVLQFVAFVGHVIFLVLTRPSKVTSNFPYNVKTSQIGIIGDDEGAADGESDSNPNPMYSVNYHNNHYHGTGPNLDIFITDKQSSSNYNNGYNQAGYPPSSTNPSLMHPPLDPYLASHFGGGGSSSSVSESPPPSYPQVMESNDSYHKSNGTTTDTTTNHQALPLPPLSAARENNTNHLPLPPLARHNQLPAIGGATANTTTLPPIRGSGLPAFAPSAPPSSPPASPDNPDTVQSAGDCPPDYSKLFQAK